MAIGACTFLQIPALALIVWLGDAPLWFAVPFGLMHWGLWLFYLWDVRQNANVPREQERRWWWAIFLGGLFVEPIYFWRFVRLAEPI